MIKIRQLSDLIDPLQSSANLNNEFLKCPFYILQHTSWSAEWTVPLNNYITRANDPADLIHLHLACCSMITPIESGEGTKLEILFYFLMVVRPNAGHGLIILKASRSHTTTHHSR